MRRRTTPAKAGFTLIEMLVVMAIIAALAGILLPVMRWVRIRTQRSKTHAEIGALATALSSYEADLRALPRTAPRTAAALFRDDAPALVAALVCKPTAELGGGPGSPYLHGTIGLGLIIDRSRLEPATMGQDGVTGCVPLGAADAHLASTAEYQALHSHRSAQPLVFVDHWGNPFHYREWASIPDATTSALMNDPPLRTGFQPAPGIDEAPVAGPVADRPRGRWQVWSNGPNGVNEFGEGDDVANW
jgi:prepilin-type N-terminal cleavage/methylation domain-containing protein